MGAVIGGVFIVLLVLGLIGAISERMNTREWRPFFGLFLIAGMIAVLGFVVGFVAPDLVEVFLAVAKWVAVVAACLLCLKVIANIAKSFFQPD